MNKNIFRSAFFVFAALLLLLATAPAVVHAVSNLFMCRGEDRIT